VKCPHCGTEQDIEPYKEWNMKGKDFSNSNRNNVITVRLFRCGKCSKAFRKGEPKNKE
jgi:hypothetical protein